MRLLTTIIFLFVVGCNAVGIVPESKLDRFSSLPDIHLCGIKYDFEYFSGDYDPVNAGDRNAANSILQSRRTDCAQYYDRLIEMNRSGKKASADSSTSNVSFGDNETFDSDDSSDYRRERNMECITGNRGVYVRGVGCTND